MANPDGKPEVVIFNHADKITMMAAVEGAEFAGWLPRPFDEVSMALAVMEENVTGALITTLGYPRCADEIMPARLYNRSTELNIPIAILSSATHAERFKRKNAGDIIIPNDPRRIPDEVAHWLGLITQLTVRR
jgi:hypothetical protein